MKKHKIIYWSTTALVALVMSYSAYAYLTSEELKGAFVHLGFPDYFRIELAIAKIIGVVLLLVPQVPAKLKEFAYYGFFITFISAFIAHTASGDPGSAVAAPVIFLALLILSFVSFTALQKKQEEKA